MLVVAGVILACSAPASHAATGSAGWANSSLKNTAGQGVLTPSDVKGASKPMSRLAFAQALVRLEQSRVGTSGRRATYTRARGQRGFTDAPAGSVGARVVELGWMVAPGDVFSPSTPITSDEAARGVIGVLGLRPDVTVFARRLRTEVPGVRNGYELRAYQVFARALSMRYNHPTGQERYEVSPNEPMSVSHVAYMLDKAIRADQWRVDYVRQTYAEFDIPDLGPNGKKLMQTAVSLVGQPYVWAGETEGTQAEGHGGFDCSGFTVRVLNGSRLPAAVMPPVLQRTSMAMSEIPKRARVSSVTSLRPGDMIFFGSKGARSTSSENFHVGISMGNGWFVHSSGGNGGVTIQKLDGWWGDSYSWGRRSLRVA